MTFSSLRKEGEGYRSVTPTYDVEGLGRGDEVGVRNQTQLKDVMNDGSKGIEVTLMIKKK